MKKILPLEACRGIAAIFVVFHHFILGFNPIVSGILGGIRDQNSLAGTVWFFFINGPGAVVFFFVLSGFVLTIRIYQTPNFDYFIVSALKRWPRLLGPVLITTLLSFLLFSTHLYFYSIAGPLTGSPWLTSFGAAGLPANFKPSFLSALYQGIYGTFRHGDKFYNSNLWTMRYEFFGSLLVLMIAQTLSLARKGFPWTQVFMALALLYLYRSPYYLSFVCGTALAFCFAREKIKLNLCLSWVLFLLGVYLLGYTDNSGQYALFAKIPLLTVELILTLGSTLLVLVVTANAQALSWLQGSLARQLGRLSFPIYLVHPLVIHSLTSYAFLELHAQGVSRLITIWTCFLITIMATFLLAWVVAIFDDWWVGQVSQKVKKWYQRPRVLAFFKKYFFFFTGSFFTVT